MASSANLEHAVHSLPPLAWSASALSRRVAHDLLDADAAPGSRPNILGRSFEAVRAQADSHRVNPAGREGTSYQFEVPDHLCVAGDVSDRINQAERQPDRTLSDLVPEPIEPSLPHPRVALAEFGTRELHHRRIAIEPAHRPPAACKSRQISCSAASRLERVPRGVSAHPSPNTFKRANLGERSRFVQDVVYHRVFIEPDLIRVQCAGIAVAASPRSGTIPAPPTGCRSVFTMDCQAIGHS